MNDIIAKKLCKAKMSDYLINCAQKRPKLRDIALKYVDLIRLTNSIDFFSCLWNISFPGSSTGMNIIPNVNKLLKELASPKTDVSKV